MTNPIVSVLGGASYPLRAIALLRRHPRLLWYVVVPIGINLVLGVGLYVGLLLPGLAAIAPVMIQLQGWLDGWEANLPAWLGWLSELTLGLGWLLRGLITISLLLGIGFLLAQFGTLLGAPWYGQLSEQVERLRTGRLTVVEVGLVRDIGRALQFEIKKLAIALGSGVVFLSLNVLPGLGTGAAALEGIAIASLLVGLDFLDGPLERRRLRFRRKLGLILRHWPSTASFSVVSLALVSIPLINLVSVPLCVIGGTLLFCDRLWPRYFQAEHSPDDSNAHAGRETPGQNGNSVT